MRRKEILHSDKLTPQEFTVFKKLREGKSLKKIAQELMVAECTVQTHKTHIYQKLGVKSHTELLAREIKILEDKCKD